MNKPVVAITAGDINGVGYECIIKGLHDPHIAEMCCPIVYGNLKVARQHAQTMDEEYRQIQWNVIENVQQAKPGRVNIVECYPDTVPVHMGVSTPEAGQAALASLERACKDIKAGGVDVLVTAPINKENIQSERFHYSGHTEYLTEQFGHDHKSLMMMVSDVMRVALVCNHVPIAKVAEQITEERILQKLTLLNDSLKADFRVRKPRIAVLALNPHAGDDGLIGEEEKTIITPAIEKAVEQGMWAFGPYSADGFFGSGKFTHFDAVLAMYHDQGLAPFKTLDMNGVNYTAGLEVIRTSPDHGTAYDLAGKNEASAESFQHALYMAIDLVATRREWKVLNENPLSIEERKDREDRRPRPEFRTFGGPKRNTEESNA